MLQPEDLVQPLGDLSADLFPVLPGEDYETPDEKLTALLVDWLEKGTEQLTGTPAEASDSALSDYVYARAKRAVYYRLLATPLRSDVEGEGGHTFDKSQIAAWLSASLAHDDAWRAAAATPIPTAPAYDYPVVRSLR